MYETLANSRKIEVRKYRLDSFRDWEIDLADLEKNLDKNSVLLINSPSNPCGSVFSKQHLLDVLQVCGRKGIRAILSDEIYAGMSFGGEGVEEGREGLVVGVFLFRSSMGEHTPTLPSFRHIACSCFGGEAVVEESRPSRRGSFRILGP